MKTYNISIKGIIEREHNINIQAESREEVNNIVKKMIENREIIISNDISEFDRVETKILTSFYKCVNDNCKNTVERDDEVCSDCIPF